MNEKEKTCFGIVQKFKERVEWVLRLSHTTSVNHDLFEEKRLHGQKRFVCLKFCPYKINIKNLVSCFVNG
jgi:hypothetical protein